MGRKIRPGGYHPLVFGDTLKNGCYRVIRKLGYGSLATVWLAVSKTEPRYVAVKVIMAKYSSPASENTTTEMQIWSVLKKANAPHVLELLDNFQEEGPNGTHTSLVYELMGGPVTSRAEYLANMQRLHTFVPHYEPYPKTLAKRILKQTLLGLDAIHRCDIVHGDIQPGNLLFTARGLDEVDESQLQHDPAKITTPLKRRDGKKDYWAPEYLAINHPLFEYAGFGPDAEIRISDFGAAFFTKSPPAEIETPVALRAPEIILNQPVNEKIDIWSFGCLVFELITGTQLFQVVRMWDDTQEDTDDDHMLELHYIIAELPDDLMALWPRSGNWFGPGRKRLYPRASKRKEENAELHSESSSPEDPEEGNSKVGNSDNQDPEKLSHEPGGEGAGEAEDEHIPPLEVQFNEEKPDDIDEDEAAVITSLIRRILKYDPAERPSAAELLQDPWFEGV